MKRFFALLLVCVMALGIVACTPKAPEPESKPNGDETTVDDKDKTQEETKEDETKEDPKTDALFHGEDKVIDIYLILGQSNAVGYTTIQDKSAANEYMGTKKFSSVLFAGATRWHNDGSVHYNDSYNWKPTELGFGVGNGKDKMGPEVGMAKALAEVYNKESGKIAGLFKYGHGGTSLLKRSWSTMADGDSNKYGTWASPTYAEKKWGMDEKTYYKGEDRTGELYREFLQIFEKKLKFLVNLGYTNVNIKGVYWMQGENDRDEPDEYKVAFGYFVSDLRRDVAKIVRGLTGGDDRGAADMPILVGLISETQNLNSADALAANQAFIEMQKTLPSVVSNCYIVDNSQYKISEFNPSHPSSPKVLGSDQWHWNQTDHLEIGYNVGKTFLEIQ